MQGLNINGKFVIGIDHGYGNMKTRNFTFKSGVKEYDKKPPVVENVLEYDGKFYVIGEEHKTFIANKDVDDDYYILTLAAIANELRINERTSADVILAVGLPLNWMSNQKESFKNYLMRKANVEYTYRGIKYQIHICNVAVYPQGFAGIAANMKQYAGVNILADIGNGTMNTLRIVNGNAISDKMYTDQLGVHQCVKKIKNELQAKFGKLPDETLIEEFLRYGVTDIPEPMLEVMRDVAEKYVESIFDKLKEYDYDPDLVKLHVIGGGGCLIQHFGKYNSDRVEIIEDIRATAKGYESIYMSMNGGMKKGA